VVDLLKEFKTQKTLCLAWYTGAGKTNVFVEMCRQLIKKNPSVKIGIWSYLTTEIRDQIFERVVGFGLGPQSQILYSQTNPDLKKNIFIFNPQSIYKKGPGVEFDYLIIDESHAGVNESCLMIKKITKAACRPETKILLVSATPWDTLALKEYQNIKVFKRPLDQGLHDGLVHDFKFHAEEAMITFEPGDFNRLGDLGATAATREMTVLKSACIGKIKYLLKEKNDEIGEKCLVICPPGRFSEIARSLAQEFGGLAYLERLNRIIDGVRVSTEDNLQKFKDDPNQRFLFVTRKCQVGFDMVALDSVIDLTMSRNISVLAQRCGRIARKNGNKKKNYFYVYDQSLMKDRLEWLVVTMIDFCLGSYDGWTTRTTKNRRVTLNPYYKNWKDLGYTFILSDVVKALRDDGLIENRKTLSYVDYSPPTKWSLNKAIEAASKYTSRTEMWSKRPALYKWFRLNAKDEMTKLFPLKTHLGKWNLESVTRVLKENRGMERKAFHRKYSGAWGWIQINKKHDIAHQFLAPSKTTRKWDVETVEALLRKTRTWAHVRLSYPGARKWMYENGGEPHWREKWESLRARGHVEGVRRPLRRTAPKRDTK